MVRHRLIALIASVSVLGYALTPLALVPCCCKTASAAASQMKPGACCHTEKPVKACCAAQTRMAGCAAEEVCKKGVPVCRCMEKAATVAISTAQTEIFVAKPALAVKVSDLSSEQERPATNRVALAAGPNVDPPGILHKTCNLLC
ncbi:MAG: hypothetical protein LDL33_05155 [Desulfomonile sp.]|nr:hypothetical protein [Desulfomonile sp.]